MNTFFIMAFKRLTVTISASNAVDLDASCSVVPFPSLFFSFLFLSFHTHFVFHLLSRFLFPVFPLSFFLPISSLGYLCRLASHDTHFASYPCTKLNDLIYQNVPIRIFSAIIGLGFKFLHSLFDFFSRLLPASFCPYLSPIKPNSKYCTSCKPSEF